MNDQGMMQIYQDLCVGLVNLKQLSVVTGTYGVSIYDEF